MKNQELIEYRNKTFAMDEVYEALCSEFYYTHERKLEAVESFFKGLEVKFSKPLTSSRSFGAVRHEQRPRQEWDKSFDYNTRKFAIEQAVSRGGRTKDIINLAEEIFNFLTKNQ